MRGIVWMLPIQAMFCHFKFFFKVMLEYMFELISLWGTCEEREGGDSVRHSWIRLRIWYNTLWHEIQRVTGCRWMKASAKPNTSWVMPRGGMILLLFQMALYPPLTHQAIISIWYTTCGVYTTEWLLMTTSDIKT